jgi:multidrug resistance efflux pump
VPDARGLFVGPARRLMTLSGLRADLVQLTVKPMPVEGIVVDQSARPGARVRRSSTVMMQVWHPTQQIRR